MNLVEAIFRAVVDISWRSSCLVLVVLALRFWLRGHLPARVLFWVWIAVAVRLLLPFAVPAAWSPFNFAAFTHRPNPTIAQEIDAGKFAAEATSADGARIPAPLSEPLARRGKLTLGQWTALVWGAGVVALVLARFLAYGLFVRVLRRTSAEPSPAVAPRLFPAAGLAGFRRVKVSITDGVRSPALHGIFQPQLLFPSGFLERLTPQEIQLTVAHELAHDQRRDLLVQVLIHTAVTLHWFNPLIWVVARVARNDCELACDESVLSRLTATERECYGATLLKIATLANGGTPPPLGLGVVESKQQMKRRIQMIVANKSSTFTGTILGCALFSLLTGLSLTRELRAQQPADLAPPSVTTKVRTVAVPEVVNPNVSYDPTKDGLGALFPNGVVAVVGDKSITVDDVRREIKQLLPGLVRESRTQNEFNQKLIQLQYSVIKELVDRVLVIQEFHRNPDGEAAKHIPAEYIDTRIADTLKEQFDNDRSKFLAYLQSRGQTMTDYRKTVEEDIIYHYMKGQERKAASALKEKQAKEASREGQIHVRLIQLKRADGETDAMLLAKANAILARLKNGESFEALARELSEDARRDKGGDWGWQGPSDLKPEFSEKLFALKKGEVSAPIVAKEGCFLLFAEDRR